MTLCQVITAQILYYLRYDTLEMTEFLFGVLKCSKIDSDGCNPIMNILQSINLYNIIQQIVWHAKYISRRALKLTL